MGAPVTGSPPPHREGESGAPVVPPLGADARCAVRLCVGHVYR